MRVLRRRLVGLACFFLSMTVFLASSDQVYGQSATPSADQLQMFQNLTPDQQQAILQSLGGNAGALGGLSGQGQQGSSTSDRQGQQRQNADNNDDSLNGRNRRPSEEDEQREQSIPGLHADDWVIIEVGFHLAPRSSAVNPQPSATGQQQLPTPQNLQALQAAQAAQGANLNQNQNQNQFGNNQAPTSGPNQAAG